MEYKAELEKLDPKVEYLMTLYLHENMLEEVEVDGQKILRGVQEVRKASKAGVKGKVPIHVICLAQSRPLIDGTL
jgi:dihydroorotase